MRIIDQAGADIESPDLSLGRLVRESVLVMHHEAQEELPRIEEPDEDNVIEEYFNEDGTLFGRVLGIKVVQEYRPASDAWDEYEDVLRYTPYTPDELAEIERQKAEEDAAREKEEQEAAAAAEAAAEREAWLSDAPGRMDAIEESQLDLDEAVTSLYEGMAEVRLDADEAITALYESMVATGAAQ